MPSDILMEQHQNANKNLALPAPGVPNTREWISHITLKHLPNLNFAEQQVLERLTFVKNFALFYIQDVKGENFSPHV